MHKRVIVFAFMLSLMLATPAQGGQVIVNGEKLEVGTVTEDGTTLIPLRAIF